ncbi:AAA family ATPase [Candidatus Parcubacteria bacterium]|nr:AAA family ATPase [Candidatus Parcubacteria bacterium]
MIVGHETVFRWFSQSHRQNRLGHGYLFVGPQHVGKATVARELAQRVLCQKGELDQTPCGKCSSCLGAADDLFEISAGSGTDADMNAKKLPEIGIASARSVRRFLTLSSLSGRRRVVIVDDGERLTNEAANMLLRTLEEPPRGALILMVCHEPAKLPQTVQSRLITVPVSPLPAKLIEAALAQEGAGVLEARKLARLSGGRVGLALTWWRSQNRDPLRAAFAALHAPTFVQRHRRLTAVFEGGPEEIHAFMDTLLTALRHALGESIQGASAYVSLRLASQMGAVVALRERLWDSALNSKLAADTLALTLS